MAQKKGKPNTMLEDEALLEDLSVSDVEGLEGAQIEGGKPLPKKVELDIDDMSFDETPEKEPEVEPIPIPTKPEPSIVVPKPEKKPETPRKRYSTFKLALLGALGLIPLIAVGLGILYYFHSQKPEMPPEAAVIPEMALPFFTVNYPENPAILSIQFKVVFPDPAAKNEFESQNLFLRDIVYRYLQGRGPLAPDDQEQTETLEKDLVLVLNSYLEKARIKSVTIKEANKV